LKAIRGADAPRTPVLLFLLRALAVGLGRMPVGRGGVLVRFRRMLARLVVITLAGMIRRFTVRLRRSRDAPPLWYEFPSASSALWIVITSLRR